MTEKEILQVGGFKTHLKYTVPPLVQSRKSLSTQKCRRKGGDNGIGPWVTQKYGGLEGDSPFQLADFQVPAVQFS